MMKKTLKRNGKISLFSRIAVENHTDHKFEIRNTKSGKKQEQELK
jgi:hypothetical protein